MIRDKLVEQNLDIALYLHEQVIDEEGDTATDHDCDDTGKYQEDADYTEELYAENKRNENEEGNEEEKKQTIVERTPSEVAGLDNLRITSWPPPDQWYTGPLEVFETSQIPSQKTQDIAEYPDPWEEAT